MKCEIFFVLAINFASVLCQFKKDTPTQARNNEQTTPQSLRKNAVLNDGDQNSVNSLTETIPGEPDSDYPTYRSIPRTTFSCKGRLNWGYYADIETDCQVFHVCHSERSKTSFFCPIGSKFNQQHLVCEWWYNVKCVDDPGFESQVLDDALQRARIDVVTDPPRVVSTSSKPPAPTTTAASTTEKSAAKTKPRKFKARHKFRVKRYSPPPPYDFREDKLSLAA